MSRKLMGRKRGMMQFFDEQGYAVACTVIEVQPNVVTQIKTVDTDGYNAIQIGFEEIQTKDPRTMVKRVSKPLLGHYKKAGVKPQRHLIELRIDEPSKYTVGQELNIEQFSKDAYVDVCGISIGKGFQGLMKLYHYRGGRASHGSSRFHRGGGSTGMRSTPGRCLPGGKRASHMGLEKKTIQNLKVLKIEDNCIIVKGAVPGARNALVYITPAMKMKTASAA